MMIASQGLRSLLALFLTLGASASEIKLMDGHTVLNDHSSPLPIDYIDPAALPQRFTWGDIDGVSYLTRSLNQHIPQYCGSCWAHGSMSALADRIKWAKRELGGDEINLSIQFILNCGGEVAGSCYGGSASGTYEFVKQTGFVPFETCQTYFACSSDSKEGFCEHVDTTCNAMNTCRTCNTFSSFGGTCVQIDPFPKATIAEYGTISMDVDAIKAEIYARGPVAANVNANAIIDYDGSVFRDATASKRTDHVVSIVGWDYDEQSGKQHWIIRNSWGEYWGDMGYFYIELGSNILGIESIIAWATPGTFTVQNIPCAEDGKDCTGKQNFVEQMYVDPSTVVEEVQLRLARQ